MKKHLIKESPLIEWWAIGLSEGECSFTSSNNYPRFQIELNIRDFSVLYKIKRIFGVGRIYLNKKNNTYMYIVTNKLNLLKIIEKFNGKLLLAKRQNQFKIWLKLYNFCYNLNIEYKNFNYDYKDIISNTAWFSGLIDGEGNFNIKKRGGSYQHQFYLYNKGEYKIYSIIGEWLFTTHGSITGNVRLNLEAHVAKNTIAFDKLINYLNCFPLRSKKAVAYAHWLKALRILKDEREKITKKGEQKLLKAIAGVKRINQFYPQYA